MSKPPYFAPWSIDQSDALANSNRVTVWDAEGHPFAEVTPFEDIWTFGEVQRLNLILTAPKLLQACKKALGAILYQIDMKDCPLHSSLDEAIPILTAVIAEALETPPGRAEQGPDPSQSKEANEANEKHRFEANEKHRFDMGGGHGIPDRPCVRCGEPDRHPIHHDSEGNPL